jgi:hypothetical protein
MALTEWLAAARGLLITALALSWLAVRRPKRRPFGILVEHAKQVVVWPPVP